MIEMLVMAAAVQWYAQCNHDHCDCHATGCEPDVCYSD